MEYTCQSSYLWLSSNTIFMKYTPGGFLIPISNPSMKFSCRAAIITLTIKPSLSDLYMIFLKNEGKVEATKMFVQQNWAVYWDEIFLMLR
ncbi:hypothetical protein H5410_044152 [Solanum commersonii]|uniref:Uncharacterized protein n=1 Tax=Solanum commersonii TaxID=4109 RepID=A0A9J5X8Y0_SOLCO|nr:hypothetical protein H5410_044152 [Solanum commersonii]